MNQILGAILSYLISSCQMHTLANEREDSIQLDWKKETGPSFWEAKVNSFDVPSGAVVEVKHQRLLRLFGGGLHDRHFLGAEGGGLFAENVFAGLERLEGEGGVEFVGDDDRDGVELGHGLEHGGDVGEDAADLVLGGGAVGGGLVDVAEGDDFGAGLAEAAGVITGHAAGSDDGDFGAHKIKWER